MRKLILFLFAIIGVGIVHAQHNVIVIIADDLGTDYFGFYEDHKDTVDVPNIRRLASKGVRFSNAMCNPYCSSTRAGIFTGRYSFRTGVGGVVGGTGGSGALDTSEISIPKMLKYFNPNIGRAQIGKWHLNNATPVSNLQKPLQFGYEHFEGPFIGQLPSYTNWTKYTNGVASNVTKYATSENIDNAVSWVKTQGKKPVFLWLAFNAPHTPYHLPPAGLHTFTSLSGTQQDIRLNPKAYFKAMIQAMDHEIGRFFDSLKTLNRWDSTDIIFIGDNGNTPLTAQITDTSRAKGTIYQYGVHVPFIVSGPSVVNPGRSSDVLLNTHDIFATVLELFGYTNWQNKIPTQKPVDSKSLLPVIKNTGSNARGWSFCEMFKLTTDSSDGKAMRNKDYKLIKFDYGKEEFYHLTTDPNETADLLKANLNSTELTNYNYLCNEMSTLIGKGTFCQSSVGNYKIQPDQQNRNIFPNPFNQYISLPGNYENITVELVNNTGKIFYKGDHIGSQDLSWLPPGIYYLNAADTKYPSLKLIKI